MGRAHSLVGKVIRETYQIERLIGTGGMGEVFEASHLRLKRRFAIKVLSHTETDSPQSIQRFEREARITSEIGHPNIIEVTDFNFTEDGLPFLVMELLDGESLSVRLKRLRRLEIHQAASVFAQAASALQAVHEKGIVHRDLKPQNIYLCNRHNRDDYVKVLDFGISKVIGSQSMLTRTHSLLGTPYYMAPEQAEEKIKEIDHRADIFAMATIVYEMLAGRRPFFGETIPAVVFNIVYKDPPPLRSFCPELPQAGQDAINKAMKKSRGDRFVSMETFWRCFSESIDFEDSSLTRSGEHVLSSSSSHTSSQLHSAPDQEDTVKDTSPIHADFLIPFVATSPLPTRQIPLKENGSLPLTSPGPEDDLSKKTTISSSSGELRPETVKPTPLKWQFYVVASLALVAMAVGIALTLRRDDSSLPNTQTYSSTTPQVDLSPETSPLSTSPSARPPIHDDPEKAALLSLEHQRPPEHPRKPSRLLTVHSRPPGAKLYIDNKFRVRTPAESLDIPSDAFDLVLRKPGYKPLRRTISKGSNDQEERFTLIPLPATLIVVSKHQGSFVVSDVFLNGRKMKQTPARLTHLEPGQYRVHLESNGFKPSNQIVHLKPGQKRRLTFELKR
jgi:serine/threonine protein kinase